jgi:hypothetical protein
MKLPARRGVYREFVLLFNKRISNPIFNSDENNGSEQKFKKVTVCKLATSVLSSESENTLTRKQGQIMIKQK